MSMRHDLPVAVLVFACFVFVACGSQKVVLVGSDDTNEVATFQLDGTTQGTEPIPKTQSTDRPLVVQDDGEVGYVGGRSGTLFAVDLTTSSPTLKTGSSSGQPGFVTLSNEITDIAQANPILLVTAGPGEGSNRGATVSSVLSGPMNEADVLNFGLPEPPGPSTYATISRLSSSPFGEAGRSASSRSVPRAVSPILAPRFSPPWPPRKLSAPRAARRALSLTPSRRPALARRPRPSPPAT
jgi:hypothetical protein